MKGAKYFDGKYYHIRFGRKIHRMFKVEAEADRFLTGLRFKDDEKTLDLRDYSKHKPLALSKQAEHWLNTKDVSTNYKRNLERWMNLAVDRWRDPNVKAVTYGMLQDLIDAQPVSQKTKHDMANCFAQFFKWLGKRERTPTPEIPEYSFTLGWRQIVDLETQAVIIAKVKEIAPHRVWLGIKWLATYIAIRPGAMHSLRERDVNVNGHFVLRPSTVKTGELMLIPMLPEDIQLYEELPKEFPNSPVFPFGRHRFYDWWKKACKLVGVEGVDLYGGTRHSSTTAMAAIFSKEELKTHGTRHGTNKAFERYCQAEAAPSLNIYEELAKRRKVDRRLTERAGKPCQD